MTAKLHLKHLQSCDSTVTLGYLDLQPPPPLSAPLSYSPPTRDEVSKFDKNVGHPLEMVFNSLKMFLKGLETEPNESSYYYHTTQV